MTDEITDKELREAIQEALIKPSEGFVPGETTAPNEAKKHGISIRRTRKILRELTELGVVEPHRVVYVDPWGDKLKIKGYRIKGE